MNKTASSDELPDGSGVSGALSPHTRMLLRSLRPLTEALDERLAGVDARLAGVDARLARVEELLTRVNTEAQGRIDEVVSNLAEVTTRVHNDAQARITEVVGVLTQTRDEIGQLRGAWTSPMYMADPQAFQLPEALGRGMGFRRLASGAEQDPDTAYREFEDLFRGPPEHVRALQEDYVGMLPDSGTIADVGCGRGEFLSLLAERGRSRIGIDMDSEMVAIAAASGQCEVLLGDGVRWLEDQAPGSLAGVFAAQVIEHMEAGEVTRFLRAAHRALEPAHGVLIAETVNPYFIPAFRMFWVDLTHKCLIYPEVALQLAISAGFTAGSIYFPGGSGVADEDLLSIGAYALVATRGPSTMPSEAV